MDIMSKIKGIVQLCYVGLMSLRCKIISTCRNSLYSTWNFFHPCSDFLPLAWDQICKLNCVPGIQLDHPILLFSLLLNYYTWGVRILSYLASRVLKAIYNYKIHSLLNTIIILRRFVGDSNFYCFEGFPQGTYYVMHGCFCIWFFNWIQVVQKFRI